MSRTRRNFSAKFKSDLVLAVLKGEKELNVIATENDIQPNLLRNWKKEFLEKASVVFDDTREENLKEKLSKDVNFLSFCTLKVSFCTVCTKRRLFSILLASQHPHG